MSIRGALWILQGKRHILKGSSFQLCKTFSAYSKETFKNKPFSWDKQSILLPGEERIRASLFADDPYKFLSEIPGSPHVRTVFDVLDHGKEVSGDGDCLGTKDPETGEYKWTQYSEVISKVQYIGSGLVELGLKPSNSTYVSILADNREEFFYTLYACAAYSMVLVPVYPSIGLDSILYIINKAESPLLVVNNSQNALKVLKCLSEIPSVKIMVLADKILPEISEAARRKNIKLFQYSELEEMGRKNTKKLVLPNPEDLCVVPFTSGTTGIPKGVMVTHKNLIVGVGSAVVGHAESGIFGETIISYLPTAHLYEIMNLIASTYFARRIAFYNEDIKKLLEEVRRLNPTVLPLVPRIMNAIYANLMNSVNKSYVKSLLLRLALSRKEKLYKRGIVTKNSIWDKIVFNKFQEVIGKNNHKIFTTSAALVGEVNRFFKLASGSFMSEGYGQTEVYASTMTLLRDPSAGHVGVPLPCNHVKLVDVPEMGYFAKDDFGEICIKGNNVFKGYLKNEEATKESLIDGWQHTGDIGRWLPNGTLKIIDRKKHIFKLSQGEYIAPEKIENVYSTSELVAQIFVDGLAVQDYVVALLVPQESVLEDWLKTKGYADAGNLTKYIQDKEVRKNILKDLRKIGFDRELSSLEQAKNLTIITEPFTVQNEILSPTLKIRRNYARKYFEKSVKEMYKEGPIV